MGAPQAVKPHSAFSEPAVIMVSWDVTVLGRRREVLELVFGQDVRPGEAEGHGPFHARGAVVAQSDFKHGRRRV